MKTIRIIAQGLLLPLLVVLVLPATSPLAGGSAWGQAQLKRTYWRWGAHRQQVLAWLRAWGPFTQPPPGLQPASSLPGKPALTGSLAMSSR